MNHIILVTEKLSLALSFNQTFNDNGYFVDDLYDVSNLLSSIRKYHEQAIIWDLATVSIDELMKLVPKIRTTASLPIFVLDEKKDPRVVTQLFKAGIDDYIIQPYDANEVLLRMKCRTRFYQDQTLNQSSDLQDSQRPPYYFGNIEVDLDHKTVKKNGTPLRLTPKEFKLLEYFLNHPQHILSREQILNGVWNDLYIDQSSRMLEMHISHLRDKIEPNPKDPTFIKTVRGFGYNFEVDLKN
ncbi:winged helix-turn-helix domain-containing protein [Fructilactobacillus fructivorans]|nr:response regulator transcription factor [Fructilactobacillus fructivorans]